jgi:hypothetical protein
MPKRTAYNIVEKAIFHQRTFLASQQHFYQCPAGFLRFLPSVSIVEIRENSCLETNNVNAST